MWKKDHHLTNYMKYPIQWYNFFLKTEWRKMYKCSQGKKKKIRKYIQVWSFNSITTFWLVDYRCILIGRCDTLYESSTERAPAKFPKPATQILVIDRALLNSPLEFVPIGINIPTFSIIRQTSADSVTYIKHNSAFKRFVWTLIYKIFSYLFYLCIILSILFDNIKFNFVLFWGYFGIKGL